MEALRELVLYKRHRASCAVHRSKVPVPKRRFWMKCDCPIWIVGRLPSGEVVPRQSTGCTDLNDAEAFRAAHIAHFTREAKVDAVHGPTIAECIEKYIESRRSELGDRNHRAAPAPPRSPDQVLQIEGCRLHARSDGGSPGDFQDEGLPADMADTSKATAVV